MGLRSGTSNVSLWAESENNNNLIGISLGWDFTSEHEWGIKKIEEFFGLAIDKLGVNRLVNRTVPSSEYLRLEETDKETILVFDDYGQAEKVIQNTLENHYGEMLYYKRWAKDQRPLVGEVIAAAWCDGAFAVRTTEPEVRQLLRDIYQAIQNKDAVIFLGGNSTPFANSGLILGIKSRIPKESIQQMLDDDKAYCKMLKDAKKTGIEKRLKKAGKKWFALSPGKKLKSTKDSEVETKYPVMFFLNPRDQQNNNSGWFTVEQLDEWIDGKGPIPKDKS